MLRIAAIGTETDSQSVISSAERLSNVDCVRAAFDSELDSFDAVVFCGPQKDFLQAIRTVARKVKYVLVDLIALKSIAEINEILTVCSDTNIKLLLGQPLRYTPSILTIKQSLEAGELGEPGLLRVHRWVSDNDAELHQLLLREIDLANYFFEHQAESIYAVSNDQSDSPRFVQVHLGFKNDGMALIDITINLPKGDDYYSVSLIGADGSAYADDHHNMQLLYGGGRPTADNTNQNVLNWTQLLQDFVAMLNESQPTTVDFEAATSALQIIDAVRSSINSGAAVHRQGSIYETV